MIDWEKNSEEILSRALLAGEEGKTLPEILALFPKNQEEIREIFEIIAELSAQKDGLNPAPEILENILSNHAAAKKNKNDSNIKGRLFFSLNIIKKELFMTQKLKIAVPVLAVLVLVVAGAYIYIGNQAKTISVTENEIFAALESELIQEAALARSEERRVGKECRSRWSP